MEKSDILFNGNEPPREINSRKSSDFFASSSQDGQCSSQQKSDSYIIPHVDKNCQVDQNRVLAKISMREDQGESGGHTTADQVSCLSDGDTEVFSFTPRPVNLSDNIVIEKAEDNTVDSPWVTVESSRYRRAVITHAVSPSHDSSSGTPDRLPFPSLRAPRWAVASRIPNSPRKANLNVAQVKRTMHELPCVIPISPTIRRDEISADTSAGADLIEVIPLESKNNSTVSGVDEDQARLAHFYLRCVQETRRVSTSSVRSEEPLMPVRSTRDLCLARFSPAQSYSMSGHSSLSCMHIRSSRGARLHHPLAVPGWTKEADYSFTDTGAESMNCSW
ncbi:hypothetical protein AGDE_15766 [Angomonas deanei]|uniref:Uncharacterized protein n=1 Tax=Angomonas deanei TaxID=59799 RepID=A0A7G2CBM1_9TRYP|nr:hypothetical protein AGDE_15766 [Angomonas deanei]CAD2216909.1 hypothetical protein, conserved [Angomonas deanei]|eukprot:EPY18516.1 hypothetical protein AGDE_15766 [Angomonas deanei]